jgi:hypothetical protein
MYGNGLGRRMKPKEVHLVTLRLLTLDSLESKEYIQKHALDSNMWEAYFPLSDLDHNAKLRECFGLLPHGVVVEMACRFAESVLDLFEKEHPGDKRPREAIMAARAWIKNPCQETRDAANAAANAAADAAYAGYAGYAGYAAARAADAANYAADAANYAAYAAAAAYYAADVDPSQKEKQIGIVLDVMREQEALTHNDAQK